MTDPETPQPTTFEAPSLEEIGGLLSAYHFEAFIAKGGMGAVYKARQISLDRPVAIKILPREFGASEDFREAFQAEAKMMAKLNHPNLIGIYDFGNIDGMPYIVMELVEGKSLFHSAHGKAIKQEKAIELILGVCHGLDHAHEAGVLHRDIKPSNILLTKEAKPKIGDFGLARPAEETEEGVIFGTPGYTAPEVLNSPEKVDARSDIYSVGVMLYELLTGEQPEETYVPVTEFVDCDPRLDDIIRCAINTERRLRYGSAYSMSKEIQNVADTLGEGSSSPLLTAGQPRAKTLSTAPKKPATGTPLLAKQSPGTSTSPTLKKSAASGAKPLTASTAGNKPAVKSSQKPTDKPAAPAPAPSGGGGSTVRNVFIILILLGAIYYAYDYSIKKKDRLAKKQKEIDDKHQKDLDEKKRIEALNRQLALENQNPRKPQPKKSTTDDVETGPELSDMEKLDRIQDRLLSGLRPIDDMPSKSFTLSKKSRTLFFVETPMTWHEADQWCQSYGGHLAVCRNGDDLNKLSSKLPNESRAWVGAATSGNKTWSWVDGSKVVDKVPFIPTGKLSFGALDDIGAITPEPSRLKLPFFIEWDMSGKNPGAFRERIARTKDSMNQATPSYLPGTMSYGSRHYAICHQTANFQEAAHLAYQAGGSLAVISGLDELEDLNDLVSKHLTNNVLGWIGGYRQGDTWQWITGEKWQHTDWDQGFPKNKHALAILSSGSPKWRDTSTDEPLAYFIIEWSDDTPKDAPAPKKPSKSSAQNNPLSKLKAKVVKAVNGAIGKNEKLHQKNIERVAWDLDFFYRGLTKGDKESHGQHIESIKTLLSSSKRIPADLAAQTPNAKIKKIITKGIDKQVSLEGEMKATMTKMREAYIVELNKLSSKASATGQASVLKSVKKELKACGTTNNSFTTSLGISR